MAESQMAARNPPWMIPEGLQNRSSETVCQVVSPGTDLSTQTIPSVRSQLGGTWIVGARVIGVGMPRKGTGSSQAT